MDTLPYTPTISTMVQVVPRVLRSQFGDGYMQEAADGINGILRNWTLIWQPIHATPAEGPSPTVKDLDDFFTAQGGYKKFLWVQPSPYDILGAQLFVCTDWSITFDQGKIRGLKATVTQRPS